LDEDLFWVFKPSQCRGPTKKLYPRTGSSWRILSEI